MDKDSNGWGFMSAAAFTVEDYTASVASSIGSSAKAAWNSEAAANTTSVIKNTTASVASSIGNSAKAAWNSELAASASSTVKNGISSASDGVKNWQKSESPETEKAESSGDFVRGGIAAMSRNASKYVVTTAGRASNVVNIFDKSSQSSLGNPRWWVRYDLPHGNVNYPHININKAVTGLPDPHIPISTATAKTAGVLGKVAEKANDIAPVVTGLAVAYETYRIGKEAMKDYEHGTSRNTVKAVATTAATYTSGTMGASAGAAAGSAILPGIGTIFGGIAGGIYAAIYGGHYTQLAAEKALDHMEWDTAKKTCNGCEKKFTWKKYEDAKGANCNSCNGSFKSKL